MFRKAAQRFRIMQETVQLATTYYDIAAPSYIPTLNWKLTALTCVILASKFHERDDNVPLI